MNTTKLLGVHSACEKAWRLWKNVIFLWFSPWIVNVLSRMHLELAVPAREVFFSPAKTENICPKHLLEKITFIPLKTTVGLMNNERKYVYGRTPRELMPQFLPFSLTNNTTLFRSFLIATERNSTSNISFDNKKKERTANINCIHSKSSGAFNH